MFAVLASKDDGVMPLISTLEPSLNLIVLVTVRPILAKTVAHHMVCGAGVKVSARDLLIFTSFTEVGFQLHLIDVKSGAIMHHYSWG